MLKKEITYRTHEGQKVTEAFYFNLTQFEVTAINLIEDLSSVGPSSGPGRVLPIVQRMIRMAVGRNIGGEFSKPENYGDIFMASDACSELLLELFGGENAEEKAALFIKNVIPANLAEAMERQQAEKAASQKEAHGENYPVNQQ